jgi:hypothetical protein
MTRELPDWSTLQAAISGEVILPESPAYETAQQSAKEHRGAFIVHSERRQHQRLLAGVQVATAEGCS